MDRLTVHTEVNSDAYISMECGSEALEPLRQQISSELRRAIGVGVSVELKPPGEFERTQFKARAGHRPSGRSLRRRFCLVGCLQALPARRTPLLDGVCCPNLIVGRLHFYSRCRIPY